MHCLGSKNALAVKFTAVEQHLSKGRVGLQSPAHLSEVGCVLICFGCKGDRNEIACIRPAFQDSFGLGRSIPKFSESSLNSSSK
jgi:hypothetical protein